LSKKYYEGDALPNLLKLREQETIYANDIEVSGKYKDATRTGMTLR
jgi:hypothetical protein